METPVWAIAEEPFVPPVGTDQSVRPLGCLDTYEYRIVGENQRGAALTALAPQRIRFTPATESDTVPLGGRALRECWNRRAEIPESWWAEATRPGMSFSQFYFDGLLLINPHGVWCWYYLRRRGGKCFWGIAPVAYEWGATFPAIRLSVRG